jgi:hypothetical protein
MTDVFISYANEDRERAGRLANALESCGWSVWWDRKIIAGQAFDEAIERELETAKCVVVENNPPRLHYNPNMEVAYVGQRR